MQRSLPHPISVASNLTRGIPQAGLASLPGRLPVRRSLRSVIFFRILYTPPFSGDRHPRLVPLLYFLISYTLLILSIPVEPDAGATEARLSFDAGLELVCLLMYLVYPRKEGTFDAVGRMVYSGGSLFLLYLVLRIWIHIGLALMYVHN